MRATPIVDNKSATTTRARRFLTSKVVDLANCARNPGLKLIDNEEPLAAQAEEPFESGQDAPPLESRGKLMPGAHDKIAKRVRELDTLEDELKRLSRDMSDFSRAFGEANNKATTDRNPASCDALLAMALLGNLANQLASFAAMRTWDAKVVRPLAQLEAQTAASANSGDRQGVQIPIGAPKV